MGGFIFKKMFEDPSPGGAINSRIVRLPFELSAQTTLSEDDRSKLFFLVTLFGKKLVGVWKHKTEFERLQAELVKKAEAAPLRPDAKSYEVLVSQDMFLEFDGFLIQIKSALDYLVKVPTPILGKKIWNLTTFGDRGRAVQKALKNNLPQEYRARVKGINDMLLEKHIPWIDGVIEARDRISHCLDGGVDFEIFSVAKIVRTDGEKLIVPMWSNDQSVVSFMTVIWENLFRFSEDFIVCFLGLKLNEGLALFHGESVPDSPESPWRLSTVSEMERVTKAPGWVRHE